jgi:hypothetical protein
MTKCVIDIHIRSMKFITVIASNPATNKLTS